MISRPSFISAIILTTALVSFSAHSAWWSFFKDNEDSVPLENVTEILWEDLIPDDFVPPENPYINMSEQEIDKLMDGSAESNAIIESINEKLAYAPVVPELDGKLVKIPAYITPLEFEGQSKISEFLLVPYVGACIHVPPPPSNQIVFAKVREAIPFNDMYEPVWAIGTIRTETVTSDLAESGYRLEVERVLPYRQRNP